MKRMTAVAGVGVALTMAFTGVASANSVKYVGTFQGQDGPALGARVKFDGQGVPQSLSLSYSNLLAPCTIGDQLFPLSGAYFVEKLKKQGNKYAFKGDDVGGGQDPGTLKGTVSSNGKKLEGEVSDSFTAEGGSCSITTKFTAVPKH